MLQTQILQDWHCVYQADLDLRWYTSLHLVPSTTPLNTHGIHRVVAALPRGVGFRFFCFVSQEWYGSQGGLGASG